MEWLKVLSAEDKETVFSFFPIGWTDQVLGAGYLKLLFDTQTKKAVSIN